MKLYKFITLLVLAISPYAQSQTAANGWVIENIHGPSQVGIVDTIPVDLNKDGLMDVVSASIEDGHLRAYINQGNLEFEQQYISTDVLGAFRVSATDFNNDGEIDFLIPSIETQEIIALIADPKAEEFGYRKQIIAKGVLLPTDAQAGDFNGDGLMDVVSISFEENVLLLHLQNQQGQFDTTIISNAPQKPRKIVIEDFNNDDQLDILLASEDDNSIRLFNGNGNASFVESLISDQMTGVRFIAKCDTENATFPNFVAGVTDADQVVLFGNEQNNTFSQKVIDPDLPGANAMHCADIDQDQQLELVAISSTFGSIYDYELEGTIEKNIVANTRDGYIGVSFADFGQNDQPKIITQAFFEHRNLLHSPFLPNDEKVVWEDFPNGAYYVDSGDLDNDGDEDIVYAAFHEDTIYWAEKKGDAYVIHVIFADVGGPQSIKLADIDLDGDIDVFSAGAWDNTFWFHQNNGNTFSNHIISNTANNAARIEILDVNGDDKLDIVGTSSLDDSLRWFDKEGVQFSEVVIDNKLNGALALSIGDINNDGYKDIIVGSFFGNQITAFYNDGLGNFIKDILSSNKIKPTTILINDVDGDLDKDVVFNVSQEGSIWLLENSNLIFNEILIQSRGVSISDMTLIDYDQNGFVDVVDISNRSGVINISTNDHNEFRTKLFHTSRIGGRSIISLPSSDMRKSIFVVASKTSNSIKKLSKLEGIFSSGFELE